jgi:hypothetical protein|tara:strand:+ start:1606 stop:1818 length:213 start_codon:yes stop_codon:yes gene_type:complete
MMDVFAKAYRNVKLPEKKESSPMGKAKGLLSRNRESAPNNTSDSEPMERIAKYVASIREDRMRIKDDRDT